MHPDFIEVYDDALDADTCARLIHRFESSGKAVRGQMGSGVDVALKNSWDICITDYAEWADAVSRFNHVVMTGFKRYLRKYAHAALAPLHLKVPDPGTGQLEVLDAERVAMLDDQTLTAVVARVLRPGTINVQKYIATSWILFNRAETLFAQPSKGRS